MKGKENLFTNTRRLNNKTGLDWLKLQTAPIELAAIE